MVGLNTELTKIKNKIAGRENDYVFITTTGRGRKSKAHIMDEDTGNSLCGRTGKGVKILDAETVAGFYSVCSYCRRSIE